MKLLTLTHAPLAALIAFAGCNAVYPTQFVPSSPLTVDYKSDSYDFKLVDLTPTSAMEANQVWAYTPRTSPEVLRSDAAPASDLVVRATSLGEEEDESRDGFLVSQVADNVSTFDSARDFKNPPRSEAKPYKIGVGDDISIAIGAGVESQRRQTTVDYAGNIFIESVGEVQVKGLSLAEMRQLVSDRYRETRLPGDAFATVTGFVSQKVLVSTPGTNSSFLAITSTPVTLRTAFLRFSSGIDADAKRQIVVLRRAGVNYPMRGQNVLRQTYGYDVYLQDGDEIQIFDELVNEFPSATVSGNVLALRNAELDRQKYSAAEARADRDEERATREEQRAIEAQEFAEERVRLAREAEIRAEEQLRIAKLNAELSQNADTRAQLQESRAQREEARRDAAEARADAADSRANRQEARARSEEARRDAAEARAERQENRALSEESRRNAAEARANAGEIRAEGQEVRAQNEESRRNAAEARASAAEIRATADEARRNAAEARADAAESRSQREEARRNAAEARATAAESRAIADEARRNAAETRAAAGEARSQRTLEIAEARAEQDARTSARLERTDERAFARSQIELGLLERDRIFVSGEVGNQRMIPLPFDRQYSLAEAIYQSDGIEPITGDPSRIYVVRVKSSVANSVESYIFNFDGANLANTAAMTMFEMRPNDLVVVLPRRVTNWSRFINQLIPTFSSIVSAARLGA